MFIVDMIQLEFPARNSAEHRKRCYEWKSMENQKDREEFFKAYGVRWTELARLEYFDLIRCTIIDPMHNLLLGQFISTFCIPFH